MLVLGRLHVLDGRGHARGLDLEHAGGAARAHELEDLGVVEGNGVHVDVDAEVLLDVGLGLGDDREGAQAQEVHLEQAHIRNRMALVLGDLHTALGIELGGHVLVHRVAADEHRACMNALAAREALDGQRRVDDAAGVLVLLIRLDEIRAVQVLFARLLLKHLLELDAGIARHHLGQALAI